MSAERRLYWASVWLAAVLVVVKASYLGLPDSAAVTSGEYFWSLAAISYTDVLCTVAFWAGARSILWLLQRHPRTAGGLSWTLVAVTALSGVYGVANIVLFGVMDGFLTYPLLGLVGNAWMLRSSIALHLTAPVLIAIVSLPLGYVAMVEWSTRRLRPVRVRAQVLPGIALAVALVWVLVGHHAFESDWIYRRHHQVAENPQWVFLSSWWQAVAGDATVRMSERFDDTDLADFEPLGLRNAQTAPSFGVRPAAARPSRPAAAARRPPNVILVVLESVAARWVSLHNADYGTTPNLVAASARGVVFNNFYAHIGRSSNSLAAMLLSTYPKLGFRDATEEYPRLQGTSLASLFKARGYQTSFLTPSDLDWADWGTFLDGRGFDEVRDEHGLTCTEPLSSWGVEDRCMFDRMIQIVEQPSSRPFFVMGWSQQTHHPYQPTPGVPQLNLLREPSPDPYDLGRYLNILHEVDRHLGRLFEAVRRAGLEKDTVIVVTGDHGQAFGYPHDIFGQGHGVYEEDVHVPLLIWDPRRHTSTLRSDTIGSHMDLAPTLAELAGLPAAADWQGRSLFARERARRAYFYVAEDSFMLGVRDGRWKYILDLREGTEELYDLVRDPNEQHSLAAQEPELCARLRERLSAWSHANRLQYEPARPAN